MIAEMLKVNFVLRKIYLSDNEIGDEGARAIAEALESNSSMEYICIRSSRIGTEKIIEQALEGCKSRRERRIIVFGCVHALINWRAMQKLGFDNHMFAFYFYPLLGIELSE